MGVMGMILRHQVADTVEVEVPVVILVMVEMLLNLECREQMQLVVAAVQDLVVEVV